MQVFLFLALLTAATVMDLVVAPRLATAADPPAAAASANAMTGAAASARPQAAASFYDLPGQGLFGEDAPLSAYRGKVALVVNVASKCGLTPQYEGLEKLYTELAPRGFVILGFPSSDFRDQEPGTPQEIRAFCDSKYGVTFPLFAKQHVKGEQKSEVYRFLTRNLEEPSWNFTKYLVDRQGKVLRRFDPKTPPDDPQLREAIVQALGQ